MAISVASSETQRTSEQERLGVHMSRRRGSGALGEEEELKKLFEELMGGDVEGAEGSEDFDWEGLWNSLMGEEETGGGQQENILGSQYPTVGGTPNTPLKFNYY